jgi:class 3 adenylate cyclase/tetratricopeptide (TPR) repeat protein
MGCPRCQADNPPQAKFCVECAAALARACSRCGTVLPVSAKFCFECATPVEGGALSADSRYTSPDVYTPRHLAECILTSKAALEGERKQVTVLFADLKGSMELLADRDPEEARRLLDPVVERMMEAVHRYEGTINQVMGDGIMALFGAPIAHEDHAVRACYAALQLQDSVKRYAEEVHRTSGIPLHIRVGLNSGEVVVRSIGNDLHMDYTAVGQTTHLAARMEQMAMPGSILITAETLRLAEGHVVVKSLGPRSIKGLADSVEVFEVVGAGRMRSRFSAAAVRGLTRFVGREGELDQLRQALGRASRGHGQVAAIVGEAGVGKSRLVWEVTHSHRTHGWLVLEAGSVSYGKATPYLALIDLLKGYFKIQDRDDPREVREKALGKVLGLDEDLKPTLPALFSLLDVPLDDPAWAGLDPSQRRQRILDAVKHLLLRESQVQPLLVVVEDLHWIDSGTQALLDSLIESLPTARLLLLVNYRPEYNHRWGQKTYYTQYGLEPLPPDSAQELLRALLGDEPTLEALKSQLIQRTEGNPFFLEESVRTLVETGALVGERGAYQLAQPLQAIQMPPTVQAILAARIDRLPPNEKRLLQTAAVIGRDASCALLQALADLPEPQLRQGLLHLQAAEFLYETSLFPEPAYTFKHTLTHEVAYGSLLGDQRRALHGRIVEAIERLYRDRLPEHIERLAHHAVRSEASAKAVTYLSQAGVKAAARSAHREAVGYFEQALTALSHLPVSRDRLEQGVDLSFQLRTSLLPLGELGRIADCLRDVEGAATTLGDRSRLNRLETYFTNYYFMTGDQARALEHGRRAQAIAADLGDVAVQAEVNLRLGQTHHALGQYQQAAGLLREAVSSVGTQLPHERFGLPNLFSVGARNWLTRSLTELGEFIEGLLRGTEALYIAEEIDQPLDIIVALQGLGFLHVRQGNMPEAVSTLERSLALCRQWNVPVWLSEIAGPLSVAYSFSGRVGQAIPMMEEAIAWDVAIRRMGGLSLLVTWLAEGYLMNNRPHEARTHTERALELARTHGERGHEAWGLRLLGEVALRLAAQQEAARDAYTRALALANDLGMRPLIAHCHVGLARVCRVLGQESAASEHRARATALLQELGMGYWLERVQATP